jgi:hypothetical protein
MGESSKTIGEIGEDIVGKFFDLIGWKNVLQNQSIPCLKPLKHARKEAKSGKRTTHGIDYLKVYKSALESDTVENILISVKHTNEPYPSNPKAKFKEFLRDIANTTECYRRTELRGEQVKSFPGNKKARDICVLFWLSSSDDTYDDLKNQLSSIRIDDDLSFEVLHLVDNKQMKFLYRTIMHLRQIYPGRECHFYYPGTSLNYSDKAIARSGSTLPVEFLTSPILPMLIKGKHDEIDTLCIASMNSFDEDSLTRLIQMAREYTNEINSKHLFLFPNFLESQHRDQVITAKRRFEQTISSEIVVSSFQPDFRSLANE